MQEGHGRAATPDHRPPESGTTGGMDACLNPRKHRFGTTAWVVPPHRGTRATSGQTLAKVSPRGGRAIVVPVPDYLRHLRHLWIQPPLRGCIPTFQNHGCPRLHQSIPATTFTCPRFCSSVCLRPTPLHCRISRIQPGSRHDPPISPNFSGTGPESIH